MWSRLPLARQARSSSARALQDSHHRHLPLFNRLHTRHCLAALSSVAATSTGPAAPVSAPPNMSTFKMINQLGKLRLSWMNALAASGTFAMLLPYDIINNAALSVGALLMACSSQAANQLIEVDRDKLMKRTMNRPLPSGAVQRSTVFAGSAFTFLAGAATLASVNTWAAYVGSLTWALYVGVYTPLKTRTVWNTQFGAVVGALPPLLGYAGAVGPTPSAFAATIPALLYMWQLPHFYGLAYWNKDDYARAGFKMLPSVDADGTKTYWAMTRASLGLAAWSYAVPALGFTSYMFAPTGLLIAGLQYYPVWKFGQFIGNSDAGNDAKRIHWGKWSFILSLASLPLMLLGMVVFGKGTDNQIRMLDSPLRRYLGVSPSSDQPSWAASVEQQWTALLQYLSSSKPKGMCPHVMLFKSAEWFCPVKIVTVPETKNEPAELK